MGYKYYGEQTFYLDDNFKVVCESQNTAYGFRHVSSLKRVGHEVAKSKACYYNRTWESYTYQSVLKSVLAKYFTKAEVCRSGPELP